MLGSNSEVASCGSEELPNKSGSGSVLETAEAAAEEAQNEPPGVSALLHCVPLFSSTSSAESKPYSSSMQSTLCKPSLSTGMYWLLYSTTAANFHSFRRNTA